MKRENIFAIVLQEIHKAYPAVKGVYVFGSFANETETESSDLDIGVLLDKPADSVILWQTAENIAIKIQRNVDLIDLSASTVFQFQIITTAKRIDTSDFKICDTFEDLTYAKYIRFNESRQEILDEIKKRGQIY